MSRASLMFHPRVEVFDANVRVGDTHNERSPAPTPAALLAEMDLHGVRRAVVYHGHAEWVSPVAGNDLLHSWIAASSGRLVPQWSVLPTNDSLRQLEALHTQGLLSSVRLHSAHSLGVPFADWVYGDLLSWLSDQAIPLWIPLPDVDAHQAVSTLRAYPALPVVLVGAHYTHALLVRPLLRALPNSHLELSRYEPLGEFEALRDEFGAERLVYGSWYPRYAMGPILFALHGAALSESELQLICAGNLRRLLRR